MYPSLNMPIFFRSSQQQICCLSVYLFVYLIQGRRRVDVEDGHSLFPDRFPIALRPLHRLIVSSRLMVGKVKLVVLSALLIYFPNSQ